MRIFVIDSKYGDTQCLDVEPNTTLSEIKSRCDLSSDYIISYYGKAFSSGRDNSTLSELGIIDGSKLIAFMMTSKGSIYKALRN